MLVRMKSPNFMDPWHIKCDYPLSWQPSMISFISLNSRNAFEFLPKLLNKRKYGWNQTSFTLNILSRSLIKKVRITRRKVVKMYKIQWSHHTGEEATWKIESCLNQNFRGFLNSPKDTRTFHTKLTYSNLGMRFFLRGKAVTP
jgi:hypothetical protein